jgi:hypothetical protein
MHVIIFKESQLASNILLNQETKLDLQIGWVPSMSKRNAYISNQFEFNAHLYESAYTSHYVLFQLLPKDNSSNNCAKWLCD